MGRRPLARDIFLSILVHVIVLVPSALVLYWLGANTKIFVEFKDFLIGGVITAEAATDKGNIQALFMLFCMNLLICTAIGKLNHLFFGASIAKDGKSVVKDGEDNQSPFWAVAIHYLFFAFFEEFLFRLVLINVLGAFFVNLYGPMIISSILFGLMHINNYGDRLILRIIPQTVTGFVLAFVFLKYGFWTAVIFHALYNILGVYIEQVYKTVFYNSHRRYLSYFEHK